MAAHGERERTGRKVVLLDLRRLRSLQRAPSSPGPVVTVRRLGDRVEG